MNRKGVGWWVATSLLLFPWFVPTIVEAQTIQSNVVTVTAGHYVQTGTQQVPETVTVPEQQCQNVQVQTGTQTIQVQRSGTCIVVVDADGSTVSTCPGGATLTALGTVYCQYNHIALDTGIFASNSGSYCEIAGEGYTEYEWVAYTTETVPVYTTEQQCKTVYVQQTQYVTEPIYSWVPTSVSQ